MVLMLNFIKKIVWNDLEIFLVRSLNYAYSTQNLFVTPKQVLITCIPKEGKKKTRIFEKLEHNFTVNSGS